MKGFPTPKNPKLLSLRSELDWQMLGGKYTTHMLYYYIFLPGLKYIYLKYSQGPVDHTFDE